MSFLSPKKLVGFYGKYQRCFISTGSNIGIEGISSFISSMHHLQLHEYLS